MHNISEKNIKSDYRKPHWLKSKIPSGALYRKSHQILQNLNISTICSEAKCPNAGECFSRGTATFLIMGNRCTRNCGFCAVEHGQPHPIDPDEPYKIAQAVELMGLNHVVITSVTRDDLTDGGALHFAGTISEVRKLVSSVRIEVLIPDFQGSEEAINTLVEARPEIINHNMETVSRLYPNVRPEADYKRSLSVLEFIRSSQKAILTKSGLMLGLGETPAEVIKTMEDLLGAGCSLLTLGQYLQPSKAHLPVKRFIPPGEFDQWRNTAKKMGFMNVASGPLVRSSYRAGELYGFVPLRTKEKQPSEKPAGIESHSIRHSAKFGTD